MAPRLGRGIMLVQIQPGGPFPMLKFPAWFESPTNNIGAPIWYVTSPELLLGIPVLELLLKAEMANSNSEAVKLIKQGSVKINGVRVDNIKRELSITDLGGTGMIRITRGKTSAAVLVFKSCSKFEIFARSFPIYLERYKCVR